MERTSGCSKEIWKVSDNIIHKSMTNKLQVDSLKTNDKLVTDPKENCNNFNHYFSRI